MLIDKIKSHFAAKHIIRGGVHPDGFKDSSASVAISTAPVPSHLYLPLRQHAGADAIPVVRVGDYVYKGQLIARASSEISAPIHASSSGHIERIGDIPTPHPSGLMAKGIVIACDGKDEWIMPEHIDLENSSSMELADAVARFGIVGMGGAIFPSSVKLKQGARHEIKTILVNGSECEPYLTSDDRLMRERTEDIVDGAMLILKILRAYRIVIAIEDNKPEAIAAMKEATKSRGMIEVIVLPALYPMGSAKQLINSITGREVPAGGRSTEVGVLVHNVGTVYAIQQALRHAKPLISRVVTVSGNCVETPKNVEVLVGTPVEDVLNFCGGLKKEPSKLIIGGPMMGQVIQTSDVPVVKGATGILALDEHEMPRNETSPCIRCARCVDACPMGLMPFEMASHAKAERFDGADDYGLKDCILCGSCAYVCPSHIPLVHYFQYAKGEKDARRISTKRNEQIKQLMEARTLRLEKQAAAKKAAKKNRKKKRPVKKAPAEGAES